MRTLALRHPIKIETGTDEALFRTASVRVPFYAQTQEGVQPSLKQGIVPGARRPLTDGLPLGGSKVFWTTTIVVATHPPCSHARSRLECRRASTRSR